MINLLRNHNSKIMIKAKVTKINFKNFQGDFKNYLIFSQMFSMIKIQPKFPKSQTSKKN